MCKAPKADGTVQTPGGVSHQLPDVLLAELVQICANQSRPNLHEAANILIFTPFRS